MNGEISSGLLIALSLIAFCSVAYLIQWFLPKKTKDKNKEE